MPRWMVLPVVGGGALGRVERRLLFLLSSRRDDGDGYCSRRNSNRTTAAVTTSTTCEGTNSNKLSSTVSGRPPPPRPVRRLRDGRRAVGRVCVRSPPSPDPVVVRLLLCITIMSRDDASSQARGAHRRGVAHDARGRRRPRRGVKKEKEKDK